MTRDDGAELSKEGRDRGSIRQLRERCLEQQLQRLKQRRGATLQSRSANDACDGTEKQLAVVRGSGLGFAERSVGGTAMLQTRAQDKLLDGLAAIGGLVIEGEGRQGRQHRQKGVEKSQTQLRVTR